MDVLRVFCALFIAYSLFCIVRVQSSCPPNKHLFTNCTDPCLFNGSITLCESSPNALCRPDYCGACVTRFYNESGQEIHCQTETGIICEQKTHTISCSGGLLLYIKNATYGRASKERCRHSYDIERLHNSTTCRANTSLSVIRDLCHGKKSCTITVENEMFGPDPCYGIYKYLEFEFTCVTLEQLSAGENLCVDKKMAIFLALLVIMQHFRGIIE